jgi:Glycosyltransferase family 87
LSRRAVALAAGTGILIALAFAIAAAQRARITEHSPITPPGAWRDVWISSLIAAFALYVGGLLLLYRGGNVAAVLVVAASIQLAPLAAPLLLSTDVYSYWDYGRIAAVHGANPYAVRPSRFPDDPAYRLMGRDWQQKRTVYGPVFTLASEAHAVAVDRSRDAAQLLFRVIAALAAVATAVLVAQAGARRAFAAAFVGWNPLLALHFGGGGHNDVLMAVFLAGALAFAARSRRSAEGALWVVAIAVKVVAVVFLPLRILERRARGAGYGWGGLAAATLAIGAAASAVYGYHWLTIFTPVANQLRSTSSLGLPYWLGKAGVSERLARDALLLAFAVAYAWLLVCAWRGRARLALAAALLLLATSWLQPWYAVWAVPLAAVEEDQLARVLTVAICAYFLRDALPV